MPLRVGLGYDLHRLGAPGPLVLGGVTIAPSGGPIAHSDGDVLIHALIDALLGACAAGDLGRLFPDDDPRWRGASGAALLGAALAHCTGLRRVLNVDAVIHLQAPRLGARCDEIAQSLAGLLGDRLAGPVAVKAKTGEGLPPIGTGDAIAAQVAVLAEAGESAPPVPAREVPC